MNLDAEIRKERDLMLKYSSSATFFSFISEQSELP